MLRVRRSPSSPAPTSAIPNLGLVCITVGPEVRYRALTRKRFLSLAGPQQEAVLRELYADNRKTLFGALEYCRANGIRLYRVTSQLFPMNDEPVGGRVLEDMRDQLAGFGPLVDELGIRVVIHPDQFVVLSSLSPAVVRQSIGILERHGHIFDLLGLPRSPWAAMIIHGGKGGRADALAEAIAGLPESVRSRLVLENDEYAYSAAEILSVCRLAGVPMVFDPHHHVVNAKLTDYGHPSVAEFTRAARDTWPDPAWQLAHISNGADSFADPRHSELITRFPGALAEVPWVEVEAKGKEKAIATLRQFLCKRGS